MIDLTTLRDNDLSLDSDAVHTVRQELWGVVVFVAAIWICFLVDRFTPLDVTGLVPRRVYGLIGVVTMTFLHQDFAHLTSNTIPLFVLLTLLAGSRARSWGIVALIVVLGGCMLWVVGRSASHKGASLLIFGLMAYLVSSGLLFERRPISVVVAIVVGLMYGMTMITGIVPHPWAPAGVSWEGHLCGAVAGILVAYGLARNGRRSAISDPV